jgi:hypothetical protein
MAKNPYQGENWSLDYRAKVNKALGFDPISDARYSIAEIEPYQEKAFIPRASLAKGYGKDINATRFFEAIDSGSTLAELNEAIDRMSLGLDGEPPQFGEDDAKMYKDVVRRYVEEAQAMEQQRRDFASSELDNERKWYEGQRKDERDRAAGDPLGGLQGDIMAPTVRVPGDPQEMALRAVQSLQSSGYARPSTTAAGMIPYLEKLIAERDTNPRLQEAIRRLAMIGGIG